MKPQKQSLNIYKVIQRPTEMKRTKGEGTEGSPSPESDGAAAELCSTSTCRGERSGAGTWRLEGEGQGEPFAWLVEAGTAMMKEAARRGHSSPFRHLPLPTQLLHPPAAQSSKPRRPTALRRVSTAPHAQHGCAGRLCGTSAPALPSATFPSEARSPSAAAGRLRSPDSGLLPRQPALQPTARRVPCSR